MALACTKSLVTLLLLELTPNTAYVQTSMTLIYALQMQSKQRMQLCL
jgi:hypothetical protein